MAGLVVPSMHKRLLLRQMNTLVLKQIKPKLKMGTVLPSIEPNIFEDTLLVDQKGEAVGFYQRSMPARMRQLIAIADAEVRSDRVPKSSMTRTGFDDSGKLVHVLSQWSVILGSTTAKPHMRRPYPARSSVHAVPTARVFTKAMIMAGQEALKLIEAVSPELYSRHRQEVLTNTSEKWRWCELFTGSIINCNGAAAVHRDALNVIGCLNVIACVRKNATGGYLHLPEYGATFAQDDGSVLVYPAWRDQHGVTPIQATHRNGHRNSFIWYVNRNLK